MQDIKEHKKSKRMTSPKDHNNIPIPGHKDVEIYDLPGKEFKINTLRKLDELQENIIKTIPQNDEKYSNKKRNLTKR